MKISDSTKIKVLNLVCLLFLNMILLFVCFRLFVRIVNVFVYFTGLITLFLCTIFFIVVILFILYRIFMRFRHFKRVGFRLGEVLDMALSFQYRLILFLSLIDLVLFFVYFNYLNNIKKD